MSLYKNKYRVKSSRLQDWDYSSPGYYFVTVCTQNRLHLFGQIANTSMHLNKFGEIVQEEWNKSFDIRREILPDEFVVMPNHFHGIVRLIDIAYENNDIFVATDIVETSGGTSLPQNCGTSLPQNCGTSLPQNCQTSPRCYKDNSQPQRQQKQPPRLCTKSVSSFMAGVKSVITKRINESRNTPGARVFQQRFYDHIIRNEQELDLIRQYIKNNPENWYLDKLNNAPENIVMEPIVPYGKEIWIM